MRSLLLAFFMMMSMAVMGQGDTTLIIKASTRQDFPQIGLDLKGRKYFVMTTTQDKRSLIALQQGLYADSMLTRYEELVHTCDSTIAQLKGRVRDRGQTIDTQVQTIQMLERNFLDMRTQRDNSNKNVDDLKKQVKKQKLPMWAGITLGIIGVILIVDD